MDGDGAESGNRFRPLGEEISQIIGRGIFEVVMHDLIDVFAIHIHCRYLELSILPREGCDVELPSLAASAIARPSSAWYFPSFRMVAAANPFLIASNISGIPSHPLTRTLPASPASFKA